MRSFLQLGGAALAVAGAARLVRFRYALAIGVALFVVGSLIPDSSASAGA